MNPATKAAAIEALESCDPGDWSTGHVIHPSYNEDKVNAALALLYAEPEPTPEPGERERFEAWCRVGDPASIQPQLERDEMGYTNRVIAACWEAWQAARASKGTR
jgi:hypothetical protein